MPKAEEIFSIEAKILRKTERAVLIEYDDEEICHVASSSMTTNSPTKETQE